MITYTIAKGSHYVKEFWMYAKMFAMARLYSWWEKRVMVVEFELTESCNVSGNSDIEGDLNKLPGVNIQAWRPSNYNSLLPTWRPGKVDELLDVTAYCNKSKGFTIGWDIEGNQIWHQNPPGTKYTAEIWPLSRDRWKIAITRFTSPRPVRIEGDFKMDVKAWLIRPTFIYYGGNTKATKDTEIKCKVSFKKR